MRDRMRKSRRVLFSDESRGLHCICHEVWIAAEGIVQWSYKGLIAILDRQADRALWRAIHWTRLHIVTPPSP